MSTEDVQDRTGGAVSALAQAAQEDLADGVVHVRRAIAVFSALAESGRGVNGISGECQGWVSHLEGIVKEVEKESGDLARKLSGAPRHEIKMVVNQELADAARAERERA